VSARGVLGEITPLGAAEAVTEGAARRLDHLPGTVIPMHGGRRPWGRIAIATLTLALLVGFVAPPSPATDPTRPPSPPKDVTFTKDHHYYSSPWYDGAWQEMIPFGCTKAPYYARDFTCPRSKPGRHHGIDMFMPCGTKVRSAVKGFVVRNPNLGTAYGRKALKIRSGKFDYVLGHVRRVYVEPGDHVRPGQLVARSGKLAAPDGCHLHFEKRPAGLGYTAAVDPLKSLQRTVVTFPDD
jgi:murein DD-endopeptidase MepM/ murein hydrolase activator NlpD